MTTSTTDDLATRARALHRRALVVDGHCDTPYRLHRHELHIDQPHADAQLDLRMLKESGIDASFFASYVPPFYANRGAAQMARRLIELIHEQVARHPGELVFAHDTAGIEAAKAAGKVAILIGVEGGHAIEDSLDILRELYDRGARYMTLTHVNNNNWADSSGEAPRHNGLTDFGRSVVRTMNDLGMIVDISHVSDKTYYDVLEITRVPVVATHSSCRALTNHPRNMTDEMLRDLAKNGGICMINFFSAFVNNGVAEALKKAQKRPPRQTPDGAEETPDDRTDWDEYLAWFRALGFPTATIDDAVDHIVHAAEVAGVDHVGIGSDFDGVPALPEGLTDATMLPAVTELLARRGMEDAEIEKILGGNFMRVFRAIEGGRSSG